MVLSHTNTEIGEDSLTSGPWVHGVHNGSKQPAGANSTSLPPLEELRDVPAWTPRRKIRVVTIGAGFSGLMLAYKFQHRSPEFQEMVEHTIFEARADIGGTWLVQRYPGVQCDVPAHVYVSFRFLILQFSGWLIIHRPSPSTRTRRGLSSMRLAKRSSTT